MDQTPLHRLLKLREVEALLADFAALISGGELALIGADGRLLAAVGGLRALEDEVRRALLNRVADAPGVVRGVGALNLYPLRVSGRLLGVCVASDNDGGEMVLRCLGRSLELLIAEASEKRDVVRDSLDRYREINLLFRISETIGASSDPAQIPSLLLDEAARAVEMEVAAVLLAGTDPGGRLEVVAGRGDPETIDDLRLRFQEVIEQVRATGRATIATTSADGSAGPAALLCAPLVTQARVLGVILLGRSERARVFTAGDEKLLMSLARQTAVALEKARLQQEEIKQQRLQEEMAIAHQIQLSLLPDACPSIEGWEFAAYYQPSRLVGGDLYDFFDLPGEGPGMGVVIADVTGKGMPAALFMASSRTMLRSEAMAGRRPAEALQNANRFIGRHLRTPLLLSAFYAIVNLQSGQVTYANAGHDWPILLRAADQSCESLAAEGFILGAIDEIKLEERSIELEPGDVMVFYTDGVTEAQNARRELFEEDRLRTTLITNGAGSARQILEAIIADVAAFAGDMPPHDDLTLVVVKRTRRVT